MLEIWNWLNDNLAGVTAVGIVAASVIAVYQFFHTRKLAAQRATLDLILNREIHSSTWSKGSVVFGRRLQSRARWTRLLNSKAPKDQKDLRRVLAFLNHFELIAIAIEQGMLDEETYQKWFKSTLVLYWDKAEPFVKALRRKRGSWRLFVRFEALAERWKNS